MARTRDPRVYEEKRQEILRAATEAFRKEGYSNATLERIAADLEVTKAAIYYYFPRKDDLLFAICEDAVNRAFANLASSSGELTVRGRLESVITAHIEELVENLSVWTVYFQEIGIRSDERAKTIVARQHELEDQLEQLIQQGIDAGECYATNPRVAVLGIFGMCNSLPRWYRRTPLDPALIASEFSALVLEGLLRPAPGSA
jgi:AcrR family transcriptional regulator